MRNNNKRIRIGDLVTLCIRIKREREPATVRPVRMRVLEFYRHFILFESAAGIKECFSHWEVKRLLRKPGKG